jgi:hypothetical protein
MPELHSSSLCLRLWLGLAWRVKRGQCWLWTKAKDKNGYGAVGHDGRILKVHRAVYELAYGVQLTEADTILHLCHTKACANPDHLLRGNSTDNHVDNVVNLRGRFQSMSDDYARFLYRELRHRFEGKQPELPAIVRRQLRDEQKGLW